MDKLKTINIRGREYVQVVERIRYFNETHKQGMIETQLLSAPESKTVVIKATVWPEQKGGRYFTGHSQAVVGDGMVNKTAALENAETSAVGRALGMMGIGVVESIASADEMVKATSPRMAYAERKEKNASYGDEFLDNIQITQ